MRYRKLGKWGLRVSEVGLGSWLTYGSGVEAAEARRCLRAAFEGGINFFDTADVYSNGDAERFLGRFLGELPRREFVVASKCYFPMSEGPNDRGLSRKHILESCDATLDRLGLEYLDLYQAHRFDDEVPLEEVVLAMDHLVRQGKILYWGTSRWSALQLADSVHLARSLGAHAQASEQPRYHLLDRSIEGEVREVARREGIGLVVYSPLAQGVLTGKYSGGRVPEGSRATDERAVELIRPWMEPAALERVDRLCALAEEAGVPPARLALAWCLRLPEVSSVIVGASRAEQIEENAATSGYELPAGLLERIEEIFA
jgi:voltage-dependent potassium channel beta subunit